MTGVYQTPPGFKLERIYQIPAGQGSWVAMTFDDKGGMICSDQHGKIYRVSVPKNATEGIEVKAMEIPLQGAHGLLWHKGVLWVSINEGRDQSGVWRVTDTNNDGEPDKPELIMPVRGRGEHGPHALVASPDGQSIYFVAGNHTDVPDFERSLVTKVWAEDQLLPRRPDARGHARDRMAPGGWIARFDTNGKNPELFSVGYRNSYDLAFNEHGDAFTYDSDMEWDLGMPWYRPTRICHVLPGSEFGWRNGTGKWPEYYEDSMPTQLDIGPGSPTGVLSGKGAKFPAKYQRSIFCLDWTFATIYAVHLTPEGRGYKATREEFVAGSGLPLTDAAIGADGAMYFLTGGRKTQSALWRVTYTGSESTAPVPYSSKPLALVSPEMAVGNLDSDDRVSRFEARTALEQQGTEAILRELKATPAKPWRVIGSAIALARVGGKEQVPSLIGALTSLDWQTLDRQQRINWLRAAGLAFARHGNPDDATRSAVLAKIDAAFPSHDAMLDRELCRLLSYLNAPRIVSRTLNLMDSAGPEPAPDWLELAKRNKGYGGTVEQMIANLPPAQVIHYVYCLRVVPGPWHDDERGRFFTWIGKLMGNSGGHSYAGFITDLRKETLATCTPEERQKLGTLGEAAITNPFANLPPVKGPGREWTVADIEKIANEGLAGRSTERGRDMFRASLCAACHRFGNEGGSSGPDLSNLGGRFTIRDLADSIVHPNAVISDQYRFDLITRPDGSQVVGKIIESKDEKWIVATNPFDISQTVEIERSEMSKVSPSPVSPMPPGLVNRLNEDELKDLLAYLLGKK
jgi:putative heme-binding domain-containing protein